ncbi:MAG: twin-arginine translocation signal domain-containing protein [Planctomycetes bacterium]|nr:twin-arginine translocation signal domain-containing protein [Planctomycetota bacterium]
MRDNFTRRRFLQTTAATLAATSLSQTRWSGPSCLLWPAHAARLTWSW